MKPLDLDAVRAFVLVAELRSFTRAADALDTTQSAVSLKLKRLESHLGRQLLERTPRVVRLAPDGHAFLGPARDLLGAHERALGTLSGGARRLSLGLSEHVADAQLARQLALLRAHDPGLVIALHLGLSAQLLTQFDERRLDAVIVRQEADEAPRGDARTLFEEPLVWLAAPECPWSPGTPLPLALLAGPCAVRAAAIAALDVADIAWNEVFMGGGVAAVGAALEAGLAVSALARRVAPRTLVDVGAKFGLPPLPVSRVSLFSRVRDPRSAATLQLLASSLGAG
ncbi:LysR family transcriptional regulator [Paraburkholderia tropica]|uniref:DNA-binding transcriptional LysR family regulator n=1 Tax=Paraburkholderia tropica TaxID=92647 RepID=A0ABX5MSQ9_9BURK|nr:LysR family transcriptional regulator [Paraburkholderia tropica]MDE1139089.1 LysR family transcriptional regulator [Paraburkholderia tropica]PXX18535.1 DNA-binding transcriptional LysR family regulator [Paraburkholderia tropica]PZW87068.1 DNA-binding transcriptional LysR family regulator [Paraburkholderia tropica]